MQFCGGAMRCEAFLPVWRMAQADMPMNPIRVHNVQGAGCEMPEASNGALIDARSISKNFQSGNETINALRDVSFDIGKGEFVSFLGPSGCGKTTLMMILVGLTSADAGEARIEGRRISAPFTNVGIVFQNPELLEWRTALENILLQIEIRRLPVRIGRTWLQVAWGHTSGMGYSRPSRSNLYWHTLPRCPESGHAFEAI
jgi:ABC-type transport system involved in cytochrome bd biosynthesis fused ATPase/permease subunit